MAQIPEIDHVSEISDRERTLLQAGSERHKALQILHSACKADARLLQSLIGKRCKKLDVEYIITSIDGGWDGYVTARGKRILASGVMSAYPKDIGPITTFNFEGD